MINVEATTEDKPFGIEITGAADSEGNPVPIGNFSISTPQSDNTSAVSVAEWNGESRRGVLHFGASNPDGTPAIANLTANVLSQDGTVAAPLGVQIAVTHGAVASFQGGFVIEGLSEGGTETGGGSTGGTVSEEETTSGVETETGGEVTSDEETEVDESAVVNGDTEGKSSL